MSFIGDIVGGIGSLVSGLTSEAPKVNTKNITQKVSTPYYNFNKGTLTPTAAAAGTGGFNGIFNNLGTLSGQFSGLNSSLSGVGTTLGGLGKSLADLRSQVAPGMGRITQARVAAIQNAGAETLGDLRTQLQRRSIAGSSFANDSEARVKLATAQAVEQAQAQGILDEIGASVQITQAEMQNQAAVLGLGAEERANLAGAVTTYMAQAQTLSTKISQELSQFQTAAAMTSNLNQVMMQGAIQQANLDMLQQTQNAANITYGLSKIGGGIFGTSPITGTSGGVPFSIGGTKGLLG